MYITISPRKVVTFKNDNSLQDILTLGKKVRKTLPTVMLTLLVISVTTLAQNIQHAEASGSIYIKPDGSIEGTDKIQRDGDLYTFTDSINDSIVVERDNMTLDGANYALQGKGSGIGIDLQYRSNITIRNLEIRGFATGVNLLMSSSNTISQNNMVNNDYAIVKRVYSLNNTLVRNNIVNNGFGIWFSASYNNTYYRNNFIGNTQDVYLDTSCKGCNSTNIWDDGLEGNYWSNYTGIDTDHDGIGNAVHEIVVNNTDHRPLMGTFHAFNTFSGYDVTVISNSTIEDFQHSQLDDRIAIHVSNMTSYQNHGFCRLTIPHALLSPPYNITINNSPVAHSTLFENATVSTVYFSYHHSSIEIVIIPEFSPLLVLPFFIIATLLTAIAFRKKWDAH